MKPRPRQIEFARLNLNYCVTSKRKCLALVKDGLVSGWNDPRMVTLSGMRRRGYPAAAIRDFCERIGVSKAYSVVVTACWNPRARSAQCGRPARHGCVAPVEGHYR